MPKTKKRSNLKISKSDDNARYNNIKHQYEILYKTLKECAEKHKCTPVSNSEYKKALKKCATKKQNFTKCKEWLDLDKLRQKYKKCINSNCNIENVKVAEFSKYLVLILQECKYHVKKYNKKCNKFDDEMDKLIKEEKELSKTYKQYYKLKQKSNELKIKLEKLKPNSDEYKKISNQIEEINKSKLFRKNTTWTDKYFKLSIKVDKCYESICKFIPKTDSITKKYSKYRVFAY